MAGKNKDIDIFKRDLGDAAKIVGSHVPGLKTALEGYEIARTANRLRRSAPKAARTAKRAIIKRVTQKPKKAIRRFKRQLGL
jgi:hypothetical protein